MKNNSSLNLIVAFIIGLAPASIVSVFIAVLWKPEPSQWFFIIFGILLILSILLGRIMFIEIKRKGALSFFTWLYSSPELDDLKKDGDSRSAKISKEEE